MAKKRKVLSHMEGFEREEILIKAFREARQEGLDLVWDTFRRIVSAVAGEKYRGVFKHRRCNRKLVYVGIKGHPNSKEYKVGQAYRSTSFSGATYRIRGHGFIGCAHFERLD